MTDTARTTPESPSHGRSTPAPPGGDRGDDAGGRDGGQVMAEAKKVGAELVGAVRDSAVALLDVQRNRAADQIAAVGEALRCAAESLDQSLEPTGGATVAGYADRAAGQIAGFADTVRRRSWAELADDVEDFARRWPMAYMASAIGIGFIAGRFMLSSAERAPDAGAAIAGQPVRAGRAPRSQAHRSAPRRGAGMVGSAHASGAKPGSGTAASGG